MKILRHIIPVLIAFLFLSGEAKSQFYNGHQMKFGKNRLQYNSFYWKYYRFNRFDVYSYDEGTELSLYVADYVEDEIKRIERFFDYNFDRRLIFLVYNKLSDFRQSNIGELSQNSSDQEEEANIGGVTEIIQNKIFLYFEGDRKDLEKQISKRIAKALVFEMLYGNDFKDNFTSSTLLNLPEWYIEGLVSYIANPWDFRLENRVKDGIVNERYEKFNRLQGEDALIAGHSFWRFIAETYGVSVIPNIIYMTRINKNINTGFLYTLGMGIKDLSDEWLGYYINLYADAESYGSLPSEGKVLKKPDKKRVYMQAKISPNGNYIAYASNELGKIKIYLYDTHTGKTKKLMHEGHKLDQITDYSYPVLAWHPSGRILAYVMEEEGGIILTYYDIDLDEYSTRKFLYYEKILDISYSPDGLKFLISGIYRGQTDIYIHSIASGTNERITNDIADDRKPVFANGTNEIIFTSNRKADSLRIGDKPSDLVEYYSVFSYDYKNPGGELRRLTNRNYSNNEEPFRTGNNRFVYLSNQSGIVNRYFAKYDSTIAFIDTVTHYRYFSRAYPITNYRRNIIEHHLAPEINKYSEIIFNNGRYQIYQGELHTEENLTDEVEVTPFRKKFSGLLQQADEVNNRPLKEISLKTVEDYKIVEDPDTIILEHKDIDIDNYIFEIEKLNLYNAGLRDENLSLVMDTAVEERPRYIDYETSFYPNNLVSQVDFSFLNASYQTFTGGAVYFNPGLNLMFKIGASDLFEDFRIIGGMRLATDFDSNEYLLSFENLKKRWDKQFIFHRQVFKANSSTSLIKTFSHEVSFILKYPFSQVAAFKGTAMFRNDRSVFLSTDLQNLNELDVIRPWISLKGEYIFDNTMFLGVNLYQGLRFKLFAEGYKQLDAKKSDLVVLGADFRHYTKIHRSLIWANRFAASSSIGHTPLIYYLGSVDNWINFGSKVETFDQSVDIDYERNYAFQTLATNMRGFSQNIRNGSNFALFNSELRWPIIRYFANRPISSSFLNNLQVVGFFDIGSAWSGLSPWSGKNSWDTEEFVNGPIRVILNSNREPIVAGYGYGLRTRLLGYFIRLDWAYGIENRTILPRIFYFSLNLDF